MPSLLSTRYGLALIGLTVVALTVLAALGKIDPSVLLAFLGGSTGGLLTETRPKVAP